MEISDKAQLEKLVKDTVNEESTGGFSFENYKRNEMMQKLGGSNGTIYPSAWKTGTTICGIVYKDGIVLGADTRATGGAEVVDKNCEKIHYLAPNIWCCGAGTAADTEKTTELIASNLELLRLNTDSESRVVTALTLLKRMLYRYQGHVSAALVLGGVDINGPHLYSIFPHGSTQRLPYVTMGSGSLAAMAVFESRFTEDLGEEDAVTLVRDAIRAGIVNDLGSGSNVDITIIRKDEVSRYRTYENVGGDMDDYRKQYIRPAKLNPPPGCSYVTEASFTAHKSKAATTPTVFTAVSSSAMDVV